MPGERPLRKRERLTRLFAYCVGRQRKVHSCKGSHLRSLSESSETRSYSERSRFDGRSGGVFRMRLFNGLGEEPGQNENGRLSTSLAEQSCFQKSSYTSWGSDLNSAFEDDASSSRARTPRYRTTSEGGPCWGQVEMLPLRPKRRLGFSALSKDLSRTAQAVGEPCAGECQSAESTAQIPVTRGADPQSFLSHRRRSSLRKTYTFAALPPILLIPPLSQSTENLDSSAEEGCSKDCGVDRSPEMETEGISPRCMKKACGTSAAVAVKEGSQAVDGNGTVCFTVNGTRVPCIVLHHGYGALRLRGESQEVAMTLEEAGDGRGGSSYCGTANNEGNLNIYSDDSSFLGNPRSGARRGSLTLDEQTLSEALNRYRRLEGDTPAEIGVSTESTLSSQETSLAIHGDGKALDQDHWLGSNDVDRKGSNNIQDHAGGSGVVSFGGRRLSSRLMQQTSSDEEGGKVLDVEDLDGFQKSDSDLLRFWALPSASDMEGSKMNDRTPISARVPFSMAPGERFAGPSGKAFSESDCASATLGSLEYDKGLDQCHLFCSPLRHRDEGGPSISTRSHSTRPSSSPPSAVGGRGSDSHHSSMGLRRGSTGEFFERREGMGLEMQRL